MKEIRLMDSSSSSDSVTYSSDSYFKRVDRKNHVTDDVWFEIFVHLPLTEIFKFRCVSKVWLSILSNPYFIKKWYKLNHLSLPWGLIQHAYRVENRSQDYKFHKNFTLACSDSHSEFIAQHQTGFSFSFLNSIFPNQTSTYSSYFLHVVGSSNGLVCSTSTGYQNTFHVCNPLTKKWVSPPTVPLRRQNKKVVTGFISNGCFSESMSFSIMRLPKSVAPTNEFQVEMFCSELGEWIMYNVSCPQTVTWEFTVYDNLVSHNGVFYWCQKENRRILAVAFNRNGTYGSECRLIGLPNGAIDGYKVNPLALWECLGESEGLICFASVKVADRNLNVWVLDGGEWYMLHKDIQLHDWFAEIESQLSDGSVTFNLIKEFEVVGFSPFDKNVVLLGSEKYIWAYNTKTRVYEQLCHPGESSTPNPFISRLPYLHHFLRVAHESWMLK